MGFVNRGATALAPWCAAVLAACASAPVVPPPQTRIRLEQAPAATAPPPEAAPLPALPSISSQGALTDAKGPRLRELHAVDQEFSTVVRQLATTFGYQYQIDPSIKGRVNTNLRDATLKQALDAIVPQGASYDLSGGVIRVGPARSETRIFTLDYVALSRVGTASTVIQRRMAQSGAGPNTVPTGDGIHTTSVADVWEEVRIAVEALTFDAAQTNTPSGDGLAGGRPYSRTSADGRRLIISAMSGTITVTAPQSRLDEIQRFIRTFEASIQRQVLIEAKVVEVSLDRNFEFGIDWTVIASKGAGMLSPGIRRSASNIEFTLNGGGTEIGAVLNALASQGDVKVLSSPRVSALNNQRAIFDVTQAEVVFDVTQTPIVGPSGAVTYSQTVSPRQINVGIVLDVLPQIGADNQVTMSIRPTVTSVARLATFNGVGGAVYQAPVIDTRESDTMARLRAGETIIIGGLMQTRHEKVKSGVPVLRSIWLIGRLFTRTVDVEHKAELVIFLTPTIIAGQPPAGR